MTRWLMAVTLLLCSTPTAIAWEMPYGVQDPMLGSAGFMNCEGHEIGYWNILQRQTPDGRKAVFLVLTTVDIVDPAFVVCVVPPDRKVMVMETGKAL